MAEQPALDAGALLAALDRHQVDCVRIGGMAVQAYGHVRTTLDLDVIAARTSTTSPCSSGCAPSVTALPASELVDAARRKPSTAGPATEQDQTEESRSTHTPPKGPHNRRRQ
jgi:hypothetical protein